MLNNVQMQALQVEQSLFPIFPLPTIILVGQLSIRILRVNIKGIVTRALVSSTWDQVEIQSLPILFPISLKRFFLHAGTRATNGGSVFPRVHFAKNNCAETLRHRFLLFVHCLSVFYSKSTGPYKYVYIGNYI